MSFFLCLQVVLLVNPDALILMALSGNHDVSLVENENLDFGQIEAAELRRPVQEFSRCSDQNMIGELRASWNWKETRNKVSNRQNNIQTAHLLLLGRRNGFLCLA